MKRWCCHALLTIVVGAAVVSPGPASALPPVDEPPVSGVVEGHPEPDFNRDGFADLAVGGDWEPLPGDRSLGVVNVLYGSKTGLSKAPVQVFSERDFGPDIGSSFGFPLTTGDFDGDGFTDLAVGDNTAEVGDVGGAGAVRVIYGSTAGLTKQRSQVWSQGSPGIADTPEEEDYFGITLIAANFGKGPQDDLAVAVRFENNREGAVHVIYGSSTGLTSAGNQFWTQKSPGVPGKGESGDYFGSSLTAGNFGRSVHADLAIGVPGDTVGAKFAAGAVNVIYGSASGLTAAGSQRWTQNSRGIPGKAEDEDELARSLAAGHFAGTAYDDLAIGVAVENDYTGAVNIIYGSAKGLTSKNSQILTQATKGMGGAAEKGDLFGVAVASANFGRDSGGGRYDDLAVGIPGEALSRRTSGAGTVQIIYGSRRGLNPANDQIISQASRGILGTAKRADEFGFCLTAHNFNRAGAADLAIGAQGERSLNVVYSTTKGLTASGNQMWSDIGYMTGGTL